MFFTKPKYNEKIIETNYLTPIQLSELDNSNVFWNEIVQWKSNKSLFQDFRAKSISLSLQGSLDHHSIRALRDKPAPKSKLLLFASQLITDMLEEVLIEEFSFFSGSEDLFQI